MSTRIPARIGAAAALLAVAVFSCAQSHEDLWRRGAALFDGAAPLLPSAVRVPERPPVPDMSLGELAKTLSREPGAVEDLIAILAGQGGDLGRAWATPERRAALAEAIRKADKAALDRLPLLTPKELLAAAKLYAANVKPAPAPALPAEAELAFSGEPKAPAPGAFLKPLGHGLLYGDESISGSLSAYGDNLALSGAFNRLADNDPADPAFTLVFAGRRIDSVRGLLEALRGQGVSLEVSDRRYFANFGDLRYEDDGVRHEVRTPVYIDTGLTLPSGRRLAVPVAHSELDVALRGPVNADLSFFFGIDGEAAFRAQDTTDMRWVGGRTVDARSGEEALVLLERAAWTRRELKAKARALGLPLGGYGPLGDCNDVNAFITGRPAYPMLRDPSLFKTGSPLDAVSNALPYDLMKPPSKAVLLDSLPFDDLSAVPFPEVREGLAELRK
ncbi:MAG: hypothetical protein WC969_07755 [Elusimicrobiota bacterium]|jgi:hypothetical protein